MTEDTPTIWYGYQPPNGGLIFEDFRIRLSFRDGNHRVQDLLGHIDGIFENCIKVWHWDHDDPRVAHHRGKIFANYDTIDRVDIVEESEFAPTARFLELAAESKIILVIQPGDRFLPWYEAQKYLAQ